MSHDRCDTSFFYLYGRKPVAGKRRRRQLREFAPHSPERLILPLRGANLLQGRGAGGCESLRLTPGKALFLRRGAQTFCREEAPAAAGVCAPFPGKPYSSVERRKPVAGKRRRRPWEFAPPSRESLISPSRSANLLQGRGAGGCGSLRPAPGKALFFRRGAQTFHPEKPPGGGVSLRLTPGKALFFRREAQTFHREEPPPAAGVCASLQGKPYSSVERRKPFTRKSPGGCGSLRLTPGKALFFRRGAQTLHPGRAPAAGGSLRPIPGKALFFR